MVMVAVDDSCLKHADSRPKSGGLVLVRGLAVHHQMNWVNSRNDLGHDDSTIDIVLGIIIIIIKLHSQAFWWNKYAVWLFNENTDPMNKCCSTVLAHWCSRLQKIAMPMSSIIHQTAAMPTPGSLSASRLVSEMTYTVSSGTLNSSIPYHTICIKTTSWMIGYVNAHWLCWQKVTVLW